MACDVNIWNKTFITLLDKFTSLRILKGYNSQAREEMFLLRPKNTLQSYSESTLLTVYKDTQVSHIEAEVPCLGTNLQHYITLRTSLHTINSCMIIFLVQYVFVL